MKKFVIARILFLSLISSWSNQSAAASSIALFQIDSQAFAIPVGYAANINSDCTFDSGKPITVGWIGDTSKVSFLVRMGMGSVMGVNISSKSPQQVVFQVKEVAKNNVNWPLTVQLAVENGQCVAKTLTPDEDQEIQTINVDALDGYMPTEITVEGPINGAVTQRQINLLPEEMASNQ